MKCLAKVVSESKLTYETGFSLELTLKALKWLFIEQDVAYWNYDGQMMLLTTIRSALK